ncbi:hypothetical protein QBC35DRAFT_551272 [Podospora australis]|uniref:Uncharacterized protein n=1 Tax=Podospora australis TaxID=1536484 RepID=A0AAN6WH49_9PEZI|nr:hypothetical protein QBC35DRAFT_551272 [Podospora australis]
MPPNRVQKTLKRSSTERRLLSASLTHHFGFVMPDCSRCLRLTLSPCKATDRSLSCSNCCSAGAVSCDVFGVPTADIQAILSEKRRLDREKDAVLAELIAGQRRLLGLEAQSRALEGRAEKALSRELSLIAEEGTEALPPSSSSGGVLPYDWAVDPSLLGDLGSVDGTAGASQSS